MAASTRTGAAQLSYSRTAMLDRVVKQAKQTRREDAPQALNLFFGDNMFTVAKVGQLLKTD